MACKVVGKDCKLTGEKLPIQIDLTDFCESRWNNRRGAGIYRLNDVVRPTPPNRTGYEYKAVQAGQVGTVEPDWPTTLGEQVNDGSVIWECQAISNDSLMKTITVAVWDGDGFTIVGNTIIATDGEQRVKCFITDDQQPGSYLVEVHVTFSDGHEEDFGVKVKMKV